MWRNFVFLQNSLFSWEVFTVISRKILFFWEKDKIFSWFFPVCKNCSLIVLNLGIPSPRIPRNPGTEWLRGTGVSQREFIGRRFPLGEYCCSLVLCEDFQVSGLFREGSGLVSVRCWTTRSASVAYGLFTMITNSYKLYRCNLTDLQCI